MYRLPASCAAAVALLLIGSGSAYAQGYFIPGAPARPAAPAHTAPHPASRPAPPLAPPPLRPLAPGPSVLPTDTEPMLQVQLPPVPELPALPRASSPPAAVIGVMGVPEVMRASQAAQMVDRLIGERRQKLNEDAQKEQAAWRDLQLQLSNQRSTMSPEQIRTKERSCRTGSPMRRNSSVTETGSFKRRRSLAWARSNANWWRSSVRFLKAME